jgi:hypothetical protein
MMKSALSPFIATVLLFVPLVQPISAQQEEAAKSVQSSPIVAATTLRNDDVVAMVRSNLSAEIISAKIQNSIADFDTTPHALKSLRADAVPDSIIVLMVAAKPGPASARQNAGSSGKLVTIPEGSLVEVETAFTINSQHVRVGESVSFRVVNPVTVGGVIVITAGATATARVVKAERGGHFGRAGRLAFEMHEVTGIDGSRVPIQFQGRVVGDSKGAKVATRTVLTGLALGPLAPLALLNGFKRGENAILPEGRRFDVFLSRTVTVNVP